MPRTPGTHENYSRAETPARGGARGFGLVFAMVFAVVALWPLMDDAPARPWALAVAIAFLVAALVRPALLEPLNRIWFAFGMLLHRIVSPLFLGFVFYLSVVPVGLVLRAFGKDSLRLQRDANCASYWIERRPPGPTADSLKNQF